MHILLVEDDDRLAAAVRRIFTAEGHVVDWVADGLEGLTQSEMEQYDVFVFDVMLPSLDGFEITRRIRRDGVRTPILLLTARDAVRDRVTGLDAGADDYLVKPFDLDELLARIRALLRRHAGRAAPLLRHGGMTLDPATRQVTLHGRPVLLSAREYAVLELLLQRPGAVLSRAQIEDRLYGWGEESESNAVSVYVHQLRKKLGADTIRSMRGVGYFLAPGGDAG